MGVLWQDVRYSLRMTARSPGFAAIVVGVLAVGIAANTALFSVVNAVLLRPLPYQDSHQLVTIREDGFQWQQGFSYRPNFFYLQEHNSVFEYLAGSRRRKAYVTGIDRPYEAEARMVTSNLFPLLGIQPVLGRGFAREDENPGSQPVVILSHAFWQEHLGGDPKVIGGNLSLTASERRADHSTVHLQENRTIVGVMPAGFTFPYARSVAFWTPVTRLENPEELYPLIHPVGRLRKTVTPEQADAELAMLLNHLDPSDADVLAQGGAINVRRLMDRLLEGHRRLPLLLLGAAGFVLLIACSNAANLFLARATVRQREMAMRMALGASRGRVARQMLTESLLLSLSAGVLGVLLTLGTIKTLVGLCPADVPRLQETRVDLTVLGFTLAVSVLTGLLFGIMPAWRASEVCVGGALKAGTGRATAGGRWRRLHGALVVSQLGLSLILLIGAALLVRTLITLTRVNLGFQSDKVLALHIELPETKYREADQRNEFFQSLLERLGALPGVDSVGALFNGLGVDYTLGATELFEDKFYVEGQGDSAPMHGARFMLVTPDYFATMGIPFLRGRTVTDQGPDNVVVDKTFARKCFRDIDPIGQTLCFGKPGGEALQVIGVVDTVRSFDTPEPGRGVVYGRGTKFGTGFAAVLVRAEGNPLNLVPAVRRQVTALERDQVITTVESLGTTLSRMVAPERFVMVLLSVFACIALTLATVGVYGLLQYSTARQTHDIGIRMALGARKGDILRGVLLRGFRLTVVGVAVGIAGAVALTRVLASLLYDVTPTDPTTLALVSCVLVAIALLASYIPARRAARVDPMTALRCE